MARSRSTTPPARPTSSPTSSAGTAKGVTNSSPFMGKYPPKAGDGADVDKLFPIYGEVPAEGGGWGRRGQTLPHLWGSTRRRRGMGPTWTNSSPFMGKYPPKAGDGADVGTRKLYRRVELAGLMRSIIARCLVLATAAVLGVGAVLLAQGPAKPAGAAPVPTTSCNVFPADNIWN